MIHGEAYLLAIRQGQPDIASLQLGQPFIFLGLADGAEGYGALPAEASAVNHQCLLRGQRIGGMNQSLYPHQGQHQSWQCH